MQFIAAEAFQIVYSIRFKTFLYAFLAMRMTTVKVPWYPILHVEGLLTLVTANRLFHGVQCPLINRHRVRRRVVSLTDTLNVLIDGGHEL